MTFPLPDGRAESECRVEVNPEDAQESATETNCSSARGTPRKRPGSVPVSARKPKKYQWMVTKVDNGNLARPRPAYFGPEDDGSDSAMDIDRPEMETDGPNCQGYPPNMQVGPQEIYAVEARSWSRAVMEREEEMSRRRKRMGEIQAQMQEHRTTLDQLEQEFRMLEMEDQKARVYLAGGPAQGYPNAPPNQELNTRSLKECPTNNNETITRYLQESSSLEPNSAILYAQRNRAEGSADVNMLSPPETVAAASPPGDHNPGADTQEYKMPIARQPQFAHPQQFRTQTNPRHTIRTQQAGRVPRGDRPSDKPFKCIEPGCKSKFAMQCQLS